MSVNIFLSKLKPLRRLSMCTLCSMPEQPPIQVKKRETEKTSQKLKKIILKYPEIGPYVKLIPAKFKRQCSKDPDYIYLVSPSVAGDIAGKVMKSLQGTNQVVAESSPGFGLVSEAMLNMGLDEIRLYELNLEFQEYLMEVFKEKFGQLTLHKRDFFSLHRYAYVDNRDQGCRVPVLLEGVPTKSWTDEPVMSVIGTLTRTNFLLYLMECIVMQKQPILHGRIDLFVITYEKIYKRFKATKKDSARLYNTNSILLQLFFDAELLGKYSRRWFLPWPTDGSKSDDDLCLVKISMKKNFPLHADHFVPFYCFMLLIFGKGNPPVIPVCEKWIPGSGIHLILPQTYKNFDIDIFTRIRDLNLEEILDIYRELITHPNYANSPFRDMLEKEWLKSETIDTDINELHAKSKKYGFKGVFVGL